MKPRRKPRVLRLQQGRWPHNPDEAICHDILSRDGWVVTKRGWPDFFCLRDGELMMVEVKPSPMHPLRQDQAMVLRKLAGLGVPCYRWSFDGGLSRLQFDETEP